MNTYTISIVEQYREAILNWAPLSQNSNNSFQSKNIPMEIIAVYDGSDTHAIKSCIQKIVPLLACC